MLEQVYIESYRTLRDLTVTFKDGLNIIIGKNGAGKSNLLDFISRFLLTQEHLRFVTAVSQNLPYRYSYILTEKKNNGSYSKYKFEIPGVRKGSPSSIFGPLVKISKAENNAAYEVHGDSERMDFENELSSTKSFRRTYIKFNLPEKLQEIASVFSLSFDSIGFLEENDFSDFLLLFMVANETERFLMQQLSLNTTYGTEKIKSGIQKTFSKILFDTRLNHYFRTYTNIEEIGLNSNFSIYKTDNGYLVENLSFEFLVNGLRMPWSYLSDGTKRTFYLISQVALAENELILIEEPEIGLHPFQLHKIMSFLKEQSHTKQIILSTHSPEVLNILDSNELDRIQIASLHKGTTTFKTLTSTQIEKAQAYMQDVGDLSYYWLHSDLESHD